MIKHSFRQSILACGAESKGVFCLAKGHKLFIGKDFGNLNNYNNFSRYEKSIRSNLKRFNIKPRVIACDMHPDYNSTTFAHSLDLKKASLIKVQHHHAHIASGMQENGLKGKVIGVAFDGTGYGIDGSIWGGEFLISSFKDFRRAAHLKYLPIPGGDKAIMEPWRMAVVYLRNSFGENFLNLGIPFTKRIKRRDWHLLKCMIDKKINSPLTSSIGRLFDGVASMLICIFRVNDEAEAAVKLQQFAQRAKDEDGRYKNNIIKQEGGFIIDPKDMIRGIIKDIKDGITPSIIAAKFHNTIAGLISEICIRLRRSNRINRVVLSGGVFQNSLLTEKADRMLKKLNFDVYRHKSIPSTDAGIPLGQAMIAEARCKRCA